MRGLVLTVSILAIMCLFAVEESASYEVVEPVIEYEYEEEIIMEDNEVEMSEFDFYQLLIREECERRGIPSDLCIAISRLETGNFTSKAFTQDHNFGGITRNGKLMSYERDYMGMNDFLDCIEWYLEHGYDTPEKINKGWCPYNDKWASSVEEIMEEIW